MSEIDEIKLAITELQETVSNGFTGIWKRIDELTEHCLNCNKTVNEAKVEAAKAQERIDSHRAVLAVVVLVVVALIGLLTFKG